MISLNMHVHLEQRLIILYFTLSTVSVRACGIINPVRLNENVLEGAILFFWNKSYNKNVCIFLNAK